MRVVSGQMYRQNVRRSKTRKKISAEATMPITIQLVSAGLPGPAMLKNSSIQVSARNAATGSRKS
jgi:hypothetical protein